MFSAIFETKFSMGLGSRMLVFVMCLLLFTSSARIDAQLDVMDFGAVGDGQSDDTAAFLKAWESLCQSTEGSPSLVIPKEKTFLLHPLVLEGPCKSRGVHIQLDGTLMAPKKGEWRSCTKDWLRFMSVENLIVDGSGGLDGQGATWWGSQDSQVMTRFTRMNLGVGYEANCDRPKGVRFEKCTNLRLSGIESTNSIKNHFSITASNGAVISGIQIKAPADSPNTDGIDISSSQNLVVKHSYIGTGDDCIAVNSGVKNLIVDNVWCGPGHGISIGSLGKDGSTGTVEDVTVQNCNFSHVQNGARIKTWAGGKGYVRGITYININLINAQRPIFIDQHYCPDHSCHTSQQSSLDISDVNFINFRGTTATLRAITLNCSSVGPGCTDTTLQNVHIVKGDITDLYSEDEEEEEVEAGDEVYAYCNNVHGKEISTVPEVPCLA